MSRSSSIAFVSDYLPRQCGIATFTADLCGAVAEAAGDACDVFVVAVSDRPEGYAYPERVRFEIRERYSADYRLAADFLNIHAVGTVCLQHEYGIYGGPCGAHVLALLRRLRRPLVTTLHTILREPNVEQRAIMDEICRLSDRLVVMSETGRAMMQEVYGVPAEKVVMIPHGIPDVPFVDPHFYKDQFGVEGRFVLMTFGLLSPGKGIEYVVQALPRIVEKHPEAIYLVVGATHPNIRRESGEEYRNGLVRLANDLGVGEHVRFVNRFVDLKELCEFLGATDVYITPYINEAQVVSGTLAYALGAGKAVISTPYWYAQELLADGRGRLVPFRDPEAIADQVIDLIENEQERHAMRKRAYTFCRNMTWASVGRQYIECFAEATEAWIEKRRYPTPTPLTADATSEFIEGLPEVDLRHLRNLTDDVGVMQHCRYITPDRRHGYCTDDNARALIVVSLLWQQTRDDSLVPLFQTYLAFLNHALNPRTGRFRNFMSYDRRWQEPVGSEDSHGRSLWGLGMTVAHAPHDAMITLATRLFIDALPVVESFTSPRAWAFAILGMHAYLRRFGGDSEVRRMRAVLSERLLQAFLNNMSDDWPWYEDTVTYANAKSCHALIMSGKWMNRNDMIDVGKRSLEWLVEVQTGEEGVFSPIGNQGWYPRGGTKAAFDQQPIEAHAMIDACVEAYRVTRESRWLEHARRAFNWFLGANDLRIPLYDFSTGGCRDGLHGDRANENQGAESTLAWLMSLLLLHDLEMEKTVGKLPEDKIAEGRPVPSPIGAAAGRPSTGASRRKSDS